LYPKFDLVRNELGITGVLTVFDIESDDSLTFEMASAIPEIKATNISQQLGGAMTYTKRYLLMNAFDIVDNNLDFDTTENTEKNETQKQKKLEPKQEEIEPAIIKSIEIAINDTITLSGLKKIWENNPKLQKQDFFKKLVNNRKNILKQNGISD
jgi:hypothetical protein